MKYFILYENLRSLFFVNGLFFLHCILQSASIFLWYFQSFSIHFFFNSLLLVENLSFCFCSFHFVVSYCSCIFDCITDLLYKANLNTGSVLEYALAFTSAALDKYCSKWSAAPKTGFIDITTSKDFYRIYSGLQIVSCIIT